MRARVLVLLMTLAAGCATAPVTMNTAEPVPADRITQRALTEPGPGRTAKVSILRDSSFAGGACTHMIDVDGKPVFGIRTGERQTLYLTSGEHELGFRIEKGLCPEMSLSFPVALRDGEEKFFQISFRALAGGPTVSEVSESGEKVASKPAKSACDSESTPGQSLTIREEGRTRSSRGTQVTYRLASTGFPASESLPLWNRHGSSCVKLRAAVQADGVVKVLGMDTLMIEDYVSGQPLELVLTSGGSSAKAKTVPFPIETQSGDYQMSVEILSETGSLFFVTGTGFQPREEVEVVTEFAGEPIATRIAASPTGNVGFPVSNQKGDDGTMRATIKGPNGSVSLEFGIGEDALVIR